MDSKYLNLYRKYGKLIKVQSGEVLKCLIHYLGSQSELKLLQQDRTTGSKWAKKSLAGMEVVQVFFDGMFFGVYVDGKFYQY